MIREKTIVAVTVALIVISFLLDFLTMSHNFGFRLFGYNNSYAVITESAIPIIWILFYRDLKFKIIMPALVYSSLAFEVVMRI